MMQESTQPPQASKVRVAVLLTCFNRREKTLECLRALAASTGLEAVHLTAILVDDGSTDGTAQAVNAEFPWVDVVASKGNLFWCRGMHLAFDTALRVGHDHYLWLNDDTVLLQSALEMMLATFSELRAQAGAPIIIVGSTVDAVSGLHTYGGERQPSRLAKFRVERIAPQAFPQRCDTITGNIVLIPAEVAARVGNVDVSFEHAMGDTDYGLRARKLGVALWLAPGVQGHCSGNATAGTYMDRSLALPLRWKRMLDRKGLPWRSWLIFTRRHTGVMWPLYFLWPYAKFWVAGMLTRSR